jgi:hypothetical protein
MLGAEEHHKMVHKSGTVSAKLCALQYIFCVQDINTNKKVKYKNFLHKVRRFWISEVQDQCMSNSDLQLPEKQTTPTGPEQDPPGRHFTDFRIHTLQKMFVGREGSKKNPARQYKNVCCT